MVIWEIDRVLYVFPYDKDEKIHVDICGKHWQLCNDLFENVLRNDNDYERFSEKTFLVWEGNRYVTLWHQYIHRLHCQDIEWYYFVDCIVLELVGSEVILLKTMHNMNMCVYLVPLHLI